jgi:hypothetical protein
MSHCILCGRVVYVATEATGNSGNVHQTCLEQQRAAQNNVERVDASVLQRAVDSILAALNRRPDLVGSTVKADREELEAIDQALLPMLTVFGAQVDPEDLGEETT